jgi:hypothetical protein
MDKPNLNFSHYVAIALALVTVALFLALFNAARTSYATM